MEGGRDIVLDERGRSALASRTRGRSILVRGDRGALIAAARVQAVLLNLAGEVAEFIFGELEQLRLIAKHGVGGSLHAAAELVKVLGDADL